MGRKPLPPDQCRSAVVRVRMTNEEEDRYMAAVKTGGFESLSAFIRDALDAYTMRVQAGEARAATPVAVERPVRKPVASRPPEPSLAAPVLVQEAPRLPNQNLRPSRPAIPPSDSFLQPQGPSLAMLGIPLFGDVAEPRVFEGFDDDYVDEP